MPHWGIKPNCSTQEAVSSSLNPSPVATPLAYAQRGRFGGRRWTRLLLAAMAAIVLGLVGSEWGPPLWRQASYRYRQGRCLSLVELPDRVIIEGVPVPANASVATAPGGPAATAPYRPAA